jgi:hypothetical protein
MGVIRKTPRWALYKCFSCRHVMGRIDDQLEPGKRETAGVALDRYAGSIVVQQRRSISPEELVEAMSRVVGPEQLLADSRQPDGAPKEYAHEKADQLCEQAQEIYAQSDGYGFAEASALFRQALEIYKQLADHDGVAECLYEIGSMAEDRGNYGKACSLYAESLAVCERWQSPRTERIRRCVRAVLP